MKRKKLGEILLDAGAISPRQLADALEDQKRYGGKLGTLLLERRYITEKDFFHALTRQLGIPAIDFTKSTIPEAVIKLLPQELIEKHAIFPVAMKRSPQGNILVLAMGDPTNVDIQDEIRFTTGLKVEPVLALEPTIRYVIREYYYHLDGKGAYRMDTELEVGTGGGPPDLEAMYGVEHSRISEVNDPEMMTAPSEDSPPLDTAGDKPVLNRELRALLKLLAKKGILTPKEYLDAFKETK